MQSCMELAHRAVPWERIFWAPPAHVQLWSVPPPSFFTFGHLESIIQTSSSAPAPRIRTSSQSPGVMGNLGGLRSIVKRGGACGWGGVKGKPRESLRRDSECFSPPGPLGWHPGPWDSRGIGGAQPRQQQVFDAGQPHLHPYRRKACVGGRRGTRVQNGDWELPESAGGWVCSESHLQLGATEGTSVSLQFLI